MITKKCTVSGQEFEITESDLDFYKKMEIISAEDYEKLKSREISDCVGLPILCPEERMRRRLAFRNERNLYQRQCDGTKKKIISMYSPDRGYIVYDNNYWWGDSWKATDYGRDFDFSRDFFPQFEKLNKKVPKMARIQQGENTNSTFCNCASYNKDSYLIFSANRNEECMYGTFLIGNTSCIDNFHILDSELLYECVNCENCYESKFLIDCKNCSDSWFLKSCIGCSNCFGCINLRNKQYYFLNKKYSKEDYKKKLDSLNLTSASSYKNLRQNFAEFTKKFPHKNMEGVLAENCSGNYVFNSKNAHECWDATKLEDCKYCDDIESAKSSYDVSFYGGKELNELLYEGEGLGHGVFEVKFSKLVWGGSSSLEYCWESFSCEDCFGCSGLRNKKYCILNKQYSKEEYFKLRDKIIEHMKKTGEWGEFFPAKLSPFAYNETVANEYFPLTKEEIEKRGLKYREEKQSFKYDGPKYEIPAKISDVPDEICEKILTCEATGKYYKIQKAELKFYRKMNLPIPLFCPEERHCRRLSLRNPRKLWQRECNQCQIKIQTTFAPNRPEKILCEKCYLQHVN